MLLYNPGPSVSRQNTDLNISEEDAVDWDTWLAPATSGGAFRMRLTVSNSNDTMENQDQDPLEYVPQPVQAEGFLSEES